jgi:D-aminoacyl-tRNA deacylase
MLKSEFAAGHVCAKYNLENLNEALIKEAMEKTIPESKFVLLDWKGLGKEKARILEILEKNNIEFQRSDKFFEK